MAASYPTSIVALASHSDNTDTIFAADINTPNAEIVAIETGLLNGFQHELFPLTNLAKSLGDTSHRWLKVWAQDADISGTATIATAVITTATLTSATITNGVQPKYGGVSIATVTLTDGATPAIDASLGSVFHLAAAGDRTLGVPSNPTPGQKIVIQHLASGGGRTLSLNTGAGGFRFGSDIVSLSQTASGKTDYVGAIYNDTASFWDVVAVIKGF